MDKFTGKVWVLGDDIDTDIIIPTEYLALKTIDDMKQYGFSPLRPELAGQIQKPDLYDDMKEGDTIDVVMNQHVDYNGKEYPIASLPENLMSIIQAGGLVKAMRKLNGLED